MVNVHTQTHTHKCTHAHTHKRARTHTHTQKAASSTTTTYALYSSRGGSSTRVVARFSNRLSSGRLGGGCGSRAACDDPLPDMSISAMRARSSLNACYKRKKKRRRKKEQGRNKKQRRRKKKNMSGHTDSKMRPMTLLSMPGNSRCSLA